MRAVNACAQVRRREFAPLPIPAPRAQQPAPIYKMAAIASSCVAARVVAGSAAGASGSARRVVCAKAFTSRGAAQLSSVKMGKASGRGALVISAVRARGVAA